MQALTLTLSALLARALTMNANEIVAHLSVARRYNAEAKFLSVLIGSPVIDAARSCIGCAHSECDEGGFVGCAIAWPCSPSPERALDALVALYEDIDDHAAQCGQRCPQWACMQLETTRIMREDEAKDAEDARRRRTAEILNEWGNTHPDAGP